MLNIKHRRERVQKTGIGNIDTKKTLYGAAASDFASKNYDELKDLNSYVSAKSKQMETQKSKSIEKNDKAFIISEIRDLKSGFLREYDDINLKDGLNDAERQRYENLQKL